MDAIGLEEIRYRRKDLGPSLLIAGACSSIAHMEFVQFGHFV
jgi:hypothetical protein